MMFEAQTEWVKPEEFPDLRQADTIAIYLCSFKSGKFSGHTHSVAALNII